MSYKSNGSHGDPAPSTVSRRVLDQRHRNRTVEVLETLADGPEGVRFVGFSDYFNSFFDFVPDDCVPYPNSAMTSEEIQAVAEVCKLLSAALEATPQVMTPEEFIDTGWPDEIMPVAQKALDAFMRRGKFDEEIEEVEPSGGAK
jgi:hypothetical protein